MSARLGFARCKLCKLLSFFIFWTILRVLLLSVRSFEGDGTARRFWGYFCGGCSLSGWVGVFFVRFFAFFYGFRTCRVGHLEYAYLIPHISNFSSKFCNIDCLTLQSHKLLIIRKISLDQFCSCDIVL